MSQVCVFTLFPWKYFHCLLRWLLQNKAKQMYAVLIFVLPDQPGDDALEILLTGATFYKDINGVGIYVKRGDRLDAQMDWYLMKLRGMIHYVSQ